MGRECRRVSANWQHPKDSDGDYIPLYDESYQEALVAWEEERDKWSEGYMKNYATGGWKEKNEDYSHYSYEEWNGGPPDPSSYRPH